MSVKLPFKSIKMTMAVLFSVITIITVILFSVISLNYTDETVLNNSIDYTTRMIDQVSDSIDSYIGYMENISNLVVNNKDVLKYLNQPKEEAEFGEERERILAQFNTVLETRKDISNIAVVGNDRRSIINNGRAVLNPNISLEEVEWYQKTEKETENILTPSHVQYVIGDHYEWVVTLSRSIRQNEAKGVFFIDLNYGVLKTLCENNIGSTDYYVYVLDEKGKIIYHPKQRLLYNKQQQELTTEVLECKESYFLTGVGEEQKLYTISVSEKTGWRVVGVAKISELMGNRMETQKLYWITAALLLSCAVLISGFLSSYITRPINRLKNSMAEVEKGHFDNACLEVTGDNEIGSLGKAFNIMTVKIQQLMQQNTYEQEQKRLNELKVLQAQINPHFLYNTLDSIIWMAEGKKNKEVVIMTASLAKLLRQSINNENELVTLEQEIGYVNSYLTIQKMRYRDKLEYEINMEESLLGEKVIKLILQPIVENAIYHGIKYKDGKGNITIKGYSRDDDMILEITDDGVGIDAETCRKLCAGEMKGKRERGIGVQNVQNRIRLYYGEGYGVTYESILGEGTKAIICLPKNNIGNRQEEAI